MNRNYKRLTCRNINVTFKRNSSSIKIMGVPMTFKLIVSATGTVVEADTIEEIAHIAMSCLPSDVIVQITTSGYTLVLDDNTTEESIINKYLLTTDPKLARERMRQRNEAAERQKQECIAAEEKDREDQWNVTVAENIKKYDAHLDLLQVLDFTNNEQVMTWLNTLLGLHELPGVTRKPESFLPIFAGNGLTPHIHTESTLKKIRLNDKRMAYEFLVGQFLAEAMIPSVAWRHSDTTIAGYREEYGIY